MLAGALVGALVIALPRAAHAEPWELAEARQILTVVAYGAPDGPEQRFVRIGVVFDSRVNHSRSAAIERSDAMRPGTENFLGRGLRITVELVPVDPTETLRSRLAALHLDALVLPEELREPEWQALLDAAVDLRLRTIATVAAPGARGAQITRRGAAVYIVRGADGRPKRYADPVRVRREVPGGTRGLGYGDVLSPVPTPPTPPTSPTPRSAPAPVVPAGGQP